jgi:hypothetical protein
MAPMAQLFPPRANLVVRTVLVAFAVFGVFVPFAVWAFARTPAATGQYRTYSQPVPFSHPLHVNGLRIDCRYCHAGAERSPVAGLPPTRTCAPCHLDSMLSSPLLAPVEQSLATGRPIAWRRVTSLPDFVFFNHAVHVRDGVACQTCHGPVQLMDQVYQAAPLTMEWCVQCHRAPERYMAVTAAGVNGWTHGDLPRGIALARRYDVARLTSCTTCHR